MSFQNESSHLFPWSALCFHIPSPLTYDFPSTFLHPKKLPMEPANFLNPRLLSFLPFNNINVRAVTACCMPSSSSTQPCCRVSAIQLTLLPRGHQWLQWPHFTSTLRPPSLTASEVAAIFASASFWACLLFRKFNGVLNLLLSLSFESFFPSMFLQNFNCRNFPRICLRFSLFSLAWLRVPMRNRWCSDPSLSWPHTLSPYSVSYLVLQILSRLSFQYVCSLHFDSHEFRA